jgi:hypothetical protein
VFLQSAIEARFGAWKVILNVFRKKNFNAFYQTFLRVFAGLNFQTFSRKYLGLNPDINLVNTNPGSGLN